MGSSLELLKMFGPSAIFLLALSVGSSLASYRHAAQAPKETCHTVFEEQSNRRCSTSYEQECSTDYRQECSTEYRQDCITEHVNQCKTDLQQECDTITETKRECNTVPMAPASKFHRRGAGRCPDR